MARPVAKSRVTVGHDLRRSRPDPDALSFRSISRELGKRERTRGALLDATAELIAVHDPGDITIGDITLAAGVANGTFYNHFESKAEIVAETAFRIAKQVGGRIYKAGVDITDTPTRIAMGGRRFIHFCSKNRTWAGALLASINYLPSLRRQIYRHMSLTVHLGAEQGRFQLDEDEFALDMLMAMALAAVRACLEGMDPAATGSRLGEMQLRVLGVDPQTARRAAFAPIEPFDLDMPALELADYDDVVEMQAALRELRSEG